MINISAAKGFASHRFGWEYALDGLRPYHGNSGIYVNDFIERAFSWETLEYKKGKNKHKLPHRFPWIGFLHNPHNMPQWFDYHHSPQAIFAREVFQESLEYCKCIIVLSEYLAKWVRLQTDVPVICVKHPTPVTRPWRPHVFISGTKQIVQVGYWLRDYFSLAELELPKYKKKWAPGVKERIDRYETIKESISTTHRFEKIKQWETVEILNFLEAEKYDDELSSSLAFVNLYDSSANNAIVESIANNIPILVNKIEPVVEYLGTDYPLYFTNLKEAEEKAMNNDLIYSAHTYLRDMNKDWISNTYFGASIIKQLREVL